MNIKFLPFFILFLNLPCIIHANVLDNIKQSFDKTGNIIRNVQQDIANENRILSFMTTNPEPTRFANYPNKSLKNTLRIASANIQQGPGGL